ncbi:MAG: transcriptional regulator [Gemmatimonadetes bacterium]|nr:transcriptional regulator [Gemmatimonadota bacterium]
MRRDKFAELVQALGEARDHARGLRSLRTTVLPAAPRQMTAADVRRLRRGLGASQAVFASFLNVSPRLVQAWEGARRTPDGPALRLLELGLSHPATVFPGLVTARKR